MFSKEGLKRGLQAATQAMTKIAETTQKDIDKAKDFQYELVNIVGESVSFVPTGLSSRENTIVEFEPYYKPEGTSPADFEVLKKVMRKLFDGTRKAIVDPETGEDSDKSVYDALPPCSEKEKNLVLQSLLHRKRLLFQELYTQGILTPDEMKKKINELRQSKRSESVEAQESLFVRNLLLHVLRLENFIQKYVESQDCINVEDIITGKLELDLSDDQIRELLKQFIFFILQSNHPLKDYTKVQPTAPAFVSRLQKNLLKERFPRYLQTYKQNKFRIPEPIARVLEAINVDPNLLKEQVNGAIQEERDKILKHIQDTIPRTPGFWQTFWTKVGDSRDIVRILDALKEQADGCDEEVQRLQKAVADLETRSKTCDQAKRALEAENARLNQRIVDLEATLKTRGDQEILLQQLREEKRIAEEDLNRRLTEVEAQKAACDEEKRALEASVASLTDQNKVLTEELTTLRERARACDEIERRAAESIEELRASHQAEIADMRRRQEETEAARKAASDALDASRLDLAARQDELVRAQTSLNAAMTTIRQRDESILALEARIQQYENEVLRLRGQISEKDALIRSLNDQIKACNAKVAELEGERADTEADMKEIEEQVRLSHDQATDMAARIQALSEELAAEKAKVADLTAQLNGVKEERDALKSGAAGSTQQLAKLTGDLQSMKEQRDAAVAERDVLKGTIETLRNQLRDADEETKAQRALVSERDGSISSLRSEVQAKDATIEQKSQEANTERQRADAAEGKANDCEGEKAAILANSEKRLRDTRDALQAQFEEGLRKQRETFDQSLEEQKADCEEAIQKERREKEQALEEKQGAIERLTAEKEEAVAKEKKEKEELLRIATKISTWINTGAEPSTAVTIPEDGPGSEEFKSIMNKLLEEPEPSTPISPKEKETRYSNICYLIYLTALLWQSNFVPLPAEAPANVIDSEKYKRQKFLQTFFNTIFDGGKIPQSERWATSSSSVASSFSFKPGLYKFLEELSSGRTTKAEFGGKLQTDSVVNARYLSILNKVARAMEAPAADGSILGLVPLDITYLDQLFKKINDFILDFKAAYPSLNLESSFGQLIANIMTVNMPLIRGDLLDSYLVKDESGAYKIVKKTGAAEPSKINYPVLFYCFLVLMRDNLYRIQQDARNAQCPLPPFLLKTAVKK